MPVRVNPAYCQLLGCSEKEALSVPIDHWIFEEDLPHLVNLREEMAETYFSHYVVRLRTKNGEIRWVDWNIAMDPYTKMRYAIGRDITAIKKLEKDLTEAKEEAVKSAKIKEEFLANMSHEIRTPMNAILGFSDLLLKGLKDQTLIDYAEAINLSSENLLVVINDILDLSKIESGKMELEFTDFELGKMLDSVVLTLKHLIQEKNLHFQLEVDASINQWIKGAPKRITQVLLNLIGNAIKFTMEGSISLFVKKIEKNNKPYLQFEVKDTGIGIPEDYLMVIFESFRQVKSIREEVIKGTGLGLAISKKLVELMGGEIYAYSTLGQGSSFYFTIPYEPSADKSLSVEQEQEEIVLPEECEVLLVEDYKLNQRLAIKYINSLGYPCDLANHGEEALNMLKEKQYNLILMDIRMPILDGIETTRRLRAMGNTTPIVALTAHALEKEKERCIEAGMNDYLTKPFKKEDLKMVIAKYGNPES